MKHFYNLCKEIFPIVPFLFTFVLSFTFIVVRLTSSYLLQQNIKTNDKRLSLHQVRLPKRSKSCSSFNLSFILPSFLLVSKFIVLVKSAHLIRPETLSNHHHHHSPYSNNYGSVNNHRSWSPINSHAVLLDQ